MSATFEHLYGDWLIDQRNKILVQAGRLDLDCGPGRAERPILLTYFPKMDRYSFFRDWTDREQENRLRLGLGVTEGAFMSPYETESALDLVRFGEIVVEEIWSSHSLKLIVQHASLESDFYRLTDSRHPGFPAYADLLGYALEAVAEWYRIVVIEAKPRAAGFFICIEH